MLLKGQWKPRRSSRMKEVYGFYWLRWLRDGSRLESVNTNPRKAPSLIKYKNIVVGNLTSECFCDETQS